MPDYAQAADGGWRVAVPLPYWYPFIAKCQCGKKFLRLHGWSVPKYEAHWRSEHARTA